MDRRINRGASVTDPLIVKRFEDHQSAKGRMFYKPLSFAYIYDEWLSAYRGKPIHFVELGVGKGGNMQTWKEYFGPASHIYGIDFKPELFFEESGIEFILGDQSDHEFLKTIGHRILRIDVFVDDGSHVVEDQVNTFEAVWPHLSPGGLYFCEDVHTSYRPNIYNGGYKKPGSMIEHCKDFIDSLHSTEAEGVRTMNDLHSVSFYSTMIVIRKTGNLDIHD